MLLKKEQILVFLVHTVALSIFTFLFLSRQNYEFLLYVGVILTVMFLILWSNARVNYPVNLLWGLTIWSIIHMAGGGIYFNGTRLYDTILIPIVGAPYFIFRYDQMAHIFGFAVATLLMFTIMKPILDKKLQKYSAMSVLLVMAGMGAGALNEVIEFFAVVIIGSTGVGDYYNTALDMVSNLVGCLLALIYILKVEIKKFK